MKISSLFVILETCLLLLFIAIYGTIALGKNDKTNENKKNWQIEQLLQNWRANFITDIKVVPADTNCSKLPFFQTGFEYNWSGTGQFCFCEEEKEKNKKIVEISDCKIGSSNSKAESSKGWRVKKGCKIINGVESKVLSIWRENKKICIFTKENLNFLQIAKNSASVPNCPQNYKLCGDKNEPDLQICIPDSLPRCPITDFKILEKNPDFEYFKEEVAFSSNEKIWISRNMGLPAVEFDITEEQMCQNKNFLRITPGREISPILLEKRTNNCEVDPRWDKIDR